MSNVYPGGLPQDGGKNLFPGTSSDGGVVQPSDGPSATSTTAGGPPSMNGTVTKDFLTSDSYQPKDMQEREGSMSTVNPDDISNSGTGKMP